MPCRLGSLRANLRQLKHVVPIWLPVIKLCYGHADKALVVVIKAQLLVTAGSGACMTIPDVNADNHCKLAVVMGVVSHVSAACWADADA